jgi:hypothetical protein
LADKWKQIPKHFVPQGSHHLTLKEYKVLWKDFGNKEGPSLNQQEDQPLFPEDTIDIHKMSLDHDESDDSDESPISDSDESQSRDEGNDEGEDGMISLNAI